MEYHSQFYVTIYGNFLKYTVKVSDRQTLSVTLWSEPLKERLSNLEYSAAGLKESQQSCWEPHMRAMW